MSRANVELVQRVYVAAAQAWRAAVSPAVLEELYDPDVVIEERADFPDSDSYHGYDGLTRWWSGFHDIYEEVRLEPQEFIPHGDRVIVRVRHVLRSKGGVTLTQEGAHVFTVKDGRVTHVTGYSDVEQALQVVRGGEA